MVVKLITDRIDAVDNKVDGVADDVKKLVLMRAQIIGGAIVASAIIGFLTQVGMAFLK